MKILVACEESQRVTSEFRKKGHEAYSCDLLDTSGDNPEWHIKCDVLEILDNDWDMVIAFPPCTYLTCSGNRWFNVEKYGDKALRRYELRDEAVEFFLSFVNCNCDKIAIENPVGVMSTIYRKPDQIIQPYEYGHPETKRTCLWLKNLPKLIPTNILQKPENGWANQCFSKDGRYCGFKCPDYIIGKNYRQYGNPDRSKLRSKTYLGIAKAMAEQWG